MPTPDFSQQFDEIWGWPQEVLSAAYPVISITSNIIVGSNPPYSYTDFIALYPQFAGIQKAVAGTSSASQIASVADVTGIAKGNYITGPGIASGTTISGISAGPGPYTLTLSNPVLSATTDTFSVVNAPTIPPAIVNAYIYLAVNSLYVDRWGASMWPVAVGLFVAHYLILWAQSQTPAGASVQQIAAAGLALGIDIGQHAGDVSYSTKPMEIEGFGAWNLTMYGQQLATFAQVIGSAGMLIW